MKNIFKKSLWFFVIAALYALPLVLKGCGTKYDNGTITIKGSTS